MTATNSETGLGYRMDKRLAKANIPKPERDAHIDNFEDLLGVVATKKDLKGERAIYLTTIIGCTLALIGALSKLLGS